MNSQRMEELNFSLHRDKNKCVECSCFTKHLEFLCLLRQSFYICMIWYTHTITFICLEHMIEVWHICLSGVELGNIDKNCLPRKKCHLTISNTSPKLNIMIPIDFLTAPDLPSSNSSMPMVSSKMSCLAGPAGQGGWIPVGNTPFLSTNFCGHCVLYIMILLIGIEVHLPVCQHAWRKSWLSGTFFLENQSMAARWGNNAEHLGRTPAACPLTVQWT